MTQERESIYQVTGRIISRLDHTRNTSAFKAEMANLRKTIGKPLDQAYQAWPLLFENLPTDFLSNSKQASDEELAILSALQLYALHQQGPGGSVWLQKDQYWENMGTSLRSLRTSSHQTAVDRRFNTMVTATNFEELLYHLRQLIKLLASRTQTQINYPKLAEDLYWYLRGYSDQVKLRWSRQYYRVEQGEKNEN